MKTIYVYAGWIEKQPLIGEYCYDRQNGIVMFRYSELWRMEYQIKLDPMLPVTDGWQYMNRSGAEGIFGFLDDSTPDRWGRSLLNRKEHYQAQEEKRRVRTLFTEDYLLGVSDVGRSGGLRFKTSEDGPFLAEGDEIPKVTSIRQLEHSAYMYEDPAELMNQRWLKDLLAPGSSLGGARPKSNVRGLDGSLWIAKFPSSRDKIDVGAWEMVCHDLAVLCDIHVPDAKLLSLSKYGHTYLVKRFDRDEVGNRIHFISAMTALGETDKTAEGSGKGFLDLAEFIASNSDQSDEDLRELFRRVVFSICVSNTDCHFRNHAFVLSGRSWRLSPAYDMNPNTEKSGLAIPITDKESAIDLSLALETADFYRIHKSEAKILVHDICKTVADNWRFLAAKYGISNQEQEYMESAFSESVSNVAT